jgi:hypothetical protein
VGTPLGDELADATAASGLGEAAGLLQTPRDLGREGKVPDLLRPAGRASGLGRARRALRPVRPIRLRRLCARCLRRRRCVLVVELLYHTTAWLCCADCALEVRGTPSVRTVYIEET